MYKRSFYQDRLGTNTGKTQKQTVFSQGEPHPENKSDWNPGDYGPSFNLFGAAMDMRGATNAYLSMPFYRFK
jgi:hypothetical protein